MPKVKGILMVFLLGCALPGLAQRSGTGAPPVASTADAPPPPLQTIMGAVQSFDGDVLDVKPPNGPAVWVTIPADVKVNRADFKPGATARVQARWDTVSYISTEAPKEK